MLIIVHLKEDQDHFCFSVDEVLSFSGCFITCIGAHFSPVELDNMIQFSLLSRMSRFPVLLHSSKWACRFGHSLEYMSGIEVLACSLNTDLNYCARTSPFLEALSFRLYSQSQILFNSSRAPFCTQGPLLNLLVKCVNCQDP